MNTKNVTLCVILIMAVSGLLRAGTALPMEIYASNGSFGKDPGFNISVSLDAIDDSGQVELTFVNNSTLDISVASIYIDSSLLTGDLRVENGPGTDFIVPAKPPSLSGSQNLPGGKIGTWSIQANSPAPFNGINTGEWLKVYLTLKTDATYEGLIDEFTAGITGRIGVHSTGFPDKKILPAAIPEPSTIGVLSLGSLMLVRDRRSR